METCKVPLTARLSACLLWAFLCPFLSCFTWFWRAVRRILSSSCCVCCFQRFPFIFYWDWSIYSHFQHPNCLMSWHHNHLRKDNEAHEDIRAPNHQCNRQRGATGEICNGFLNREAIAQGQRMTLTMQTESLKRSGKLSTWKPGELLQIFVDSDELSDWI